MLLLLEILAVPAAILILFLTGVLVVRNALGLRKTVKRFQSKVEPKAFYIMDQSEAAQRRVFSIVEEREVLLRRLLVLQATIRKMRVIVSAAREAWRPVARALDYVGF